MRKLAQRKNSFPQNAVLCFKKMFSAKCGKIVGSSPTMTQVGAYTQAVDFAKQKRHFSLIELILKNNLLRKEFR